MNTGVAPDGCFQGLVSALTGDVGTIATWLPGGQALTIIGHYWVIIDQY